jgi:hypothetical protein
MKTVNKSGGWLGVVQWILVAVFGALALVACGGGGSDSSGTVTPDLQGTWRVSLSQNGTTSQGGTVAAANVPSQQQVASITTASFAQLLGSSSYAGYTVVLNGGTLTITGSGTNLVIVVNSVSTGNYKSCGLSCGVGAAVSYDVTVYLTANGTLNGQPVSGTQTGTVTVIYTRVS